MTERHKIVLSCLLGSLIVLGAAAYLKPRDPACVKLEAKRNLAEEFCKGLAMRAAQERCSQLAEDPETMGACMQVVVPVAQASCWGYLSVENMDREIESLCQ
jgi:hypothetical protein